MSPSEFESEFGLVATASHTGPFLTQDEKVRAELREICEGLIESAIAKIDDLLGKGNS